ncbi:hypothetical protein FRC01_000028 [Tulasnella sp. 417]|nr:hypothetical protein FRC01_000028 [Tulasnella sp. 417]
MFASRAAETATPRQPPTIPALDFAPLTGDDSILSITSTSTTTSEGSLAPPLLPSKKGGSKRVLVPKKPLQQSNQPTPSTLGSSTISASRPAAKSLRRPLNDENSYQPPSEWSVVPPPPPPRTVGNPHQFASARRIAPPVAAPVHAQPQPKPEPVAILPVKTEDGSSKTVGHSRHSSIGASSVRTTTSVRSTGTIRTQKGNTLRVYADEPNSQDTPVLVKKKKSRLALDLGWALGDKTNGQTKDKEVNTPISATSTRAPTPTLKEKGSLSRLSNILKSKSSTLRLSTGSSPDKENVDAKDKDKWKWSIGLSRGRKENSVKEVFGGRRAKSPEPAPPAIRNLSSFASSAGPVEYEYRTPSLDDHPPSLTPRPIEKDPAPSIPPTIRSVSAPLTSITTLSDTLPRPVSARPVSVRIPSGPSNKHHYRTFSADAAAILHPIESPVAMTRFEPDPDQTPIRRPASPSVLAKRGDDSPVSPTADTPTYNSDSLAIRAMRSVRSMARLFVGPEDDEKENKEKETKVKKRHSRMTLKGMGIDVFAGHERRHSSSSQESWVAGAPSPTEASSSTATKSPNMPAVGVTVDRPIVSASVRERMSTSISVRPPSSEVEAPPRPSVETFGTMRIQKGRRSGSTRRTLSTASNITAISSGTNSSNDSGYGAMPGSRDASRRISSAGSGGRLSLFSALSSKSSQGNLNAKPAADSLTNKTARKRGSLAGLFDLAASMASSSGSRSRRSSRVSKGSVESAGSRHSSGSEPTQTPTQDAHAANARDRLEERIRTYNTLHTIPASPAPIQEEEDELSSSGLDTITNPQITRPSIPTFQPRTLTRNVTVTYGGSISKARQQDVTPQRRLKPKRRPASDHLLSSWEVEKRQGVVSDEEGAVAISMVNAATSELGDLINHLDLAGTPEATPVKNATPRRPRAFTTGDSPVSALQEATKQWSWSPLKGRNVSTAHLPQPPLMPTAPLSTGNSTFGRRIARPELPIEQSPTEYITSSRRSSTTTATMDGSDSIFDSPLKNRGRKQSGGSLLTSLGKASTGTMLSLHDRSFGKGSTGTMLSAFGPSKGSTNTHGAVGDVSLTAFGPGRLDNSRVEETHGEADDSDIPEELQELLSSNSEDTSLGSTEANLFCDLSIPGSASALMSSAHIESLLRRPSQTGNKSSVASIPPTSVPAIPLPAQPSLAKVSSSSSLSVAHHTDEIKAGSAIPRSSASKPASENLNRLSTSALHDHSTSLDTLDEEDSLSASDEDITDHTGRSSFDFTKELNRLNEGGSRQSFVEQLANTWKPPSQSTGTRAAQEMPPLPSLDFLRQITHQDKADIDSQKQASSDDLPLAPNPDSTMYAIANLDLSLVLPSDSPKKSKAPAKPVGRKVDHVRASSLSESLDASMAALTSLNQSVNHPSKPRPHSTTIESDVSKRHTRIAQARAYKRFQNMRERTFSAATTASFGSVVNPGAPDPFNYSHPTSDLEASGDESSAENSERRQNQTVASIPSISSYGAVLNSGVRNPFGYDVTMDYSQSVEMARGCNPRYSIDSDRSSFYFDSSKLAARGQRGDDSIMSSRSKSTRPLSFRQQPRPDSIMSTSSFAWGHGSQGMQGSRTSWAKDRHDPARDSILSEFSFRRLSRPGLGDKMFESGPLYSIAGSPAQSSPCMEFGREDNCQNLRRSIDSADSRSVRFSVDSIFDKTGSNTSSISSPSVFGYDESGVSASQSFFAAGVKPQFRPLSMFSMASECDSSREDDTMISMLGGDHTKVPRASLGSAVNSSPCVRAEKKRRAAWKARNEDSLQSSQLSGISMSSTDAQEEAIISQGNMSFSPFSFDESEKSREAEPVSTQENVQILDQFLSASANPSWVDLNGSINQSEPVVFRPASPPTPPLSYASSVDGSQSSIDVEKLKMLLESSAPPSFNPDRLRPQGKGHRRRSHMSEMSRISVIESIAEEVTSESGSPRAPTFESIPEPSIVIWDTQSRRSSWRESIDWESEFGVMLRRFYSLQTEARETVQESQNMWLDTDFSRFALATFDPPRNPAGIQALLEHSQKMFNPLPLELCVRKPRSRANSRPSPYPRGPAKTISGQPFRRHGRTPSVESAINCISPFPNPLSSSTTELSVSPSPATLSSSSVNFQSATDSVPQENTHPAPSLCSVIEADAKRNVLGRRIGKPVDKTNTKSVNEWAFGKKISEVLGNKSATKSHGVSNSSATAKENRETEAQGTLTRNTSLRISRARPPRRPTAASVLAPNTLRV